MIKTRMQKGITLIALIITIIILLILAVVTIGSIKDSNIITYAQNASTDYNKEKDKEESTILGYESLIESNLPENSKVGKAEVGKIADVNSTINGKAYSSTNPIIPAGFAAINITTEGQESSWDAKAGPEVNKGLVITDNVTKDASGKATIGSEFVWIPVEEINDMIMCQVCGAGKILDEKTLQCPTCLENTKLAGKLYATSVGNNFNSTTTGQIYENDSFREPDVNTGATGDDSTAGEQYDYLYLSKVLEGDYAKEQTAASFKAQLQNEFNSMVKSVAKYGGFYMGRYEVSLTTGKTAQSKYGAISSNAAQTDTYMWYGLYTKSKTYLSAKKSVQSTMVWGSQYDVMMIWMEKNGVNVTELREDLINTERTGGTNSKDVIKNVYDLYGNSNEWTLEAYGTAGRIYRGGYCDSINTSPSDRGGLAPDRNWFRDVHGSRITLYIL